MKYEQQITLKNGKTAILRSAVEADGKAVLENFISTHEETDYLLPYADEISIGVKDEEEFLKRKSESENEIQIIAVVDGVVVGNAGITSLGTRHKVHHRAEFGISILKEFWGLGIGKALTNACISCAKEAGYEQLELEVVAENTSAVALYKKAGFVEFGRNPKGFKSRISGYQELVSMRLELDK